MTEVLRPSTNREAPPSARPPAWREQRCDARRAGFLPDRVERKAPSQQVPTVCRDLAARPNYPGGYGGTRGTIGNECTIGTRSVILLFGRPAQDQKWVFV